MSKLLRKTWFWVALPIVLMALLVLASALVSSGEGVAPLDYALF